jgi:hypothetical protein
VDVRASEAPSSSEWMAKTVTTTCA